MTREQVIKLIVPILFAWRIGNKKQCAQVASEILDELKFRGLDLQFNDAQ